MLREGELQPRPTGIGWQLVGHQSECAVVGHRVFRDAVGHTAANDSLQRKSEWRCSDLLDSGLQRHAVWNDVRQWQRRFWNRLLDQRGLAAEVGWRRRIELRDLLKAVCPILAAFARVGIFRSSISKNPVVVEPKPAPFEKHKGWGTRARNISHSRLTLSLAIGPVRYSFHAQIWLIERFRNEKV
jgi:hypothetical protein